MAFKVRDRDEALALVDALKNGKIKPEAQQEVMEGLQRFGQHFQQIQNAKAEGRGMFDEAPEGESRIESALNIIGRRGIGNLDATATFLSGAIAEVPAGLYGLGQWIAGGRDAEAADAAANSIRAIQDALTWDPKTIEGQETLETIAAPLMKLDDAADYMATKYGNGNPHAEAAIYSTLIGLPDVAGMLVGAKMSGRSALGRRMREVEQKAANIGVDVKQTELPSSIVQAAARMTPEERFARTADLQDALSQAEEVARANKRRIEGIARAKEATVQSGGVADFAKGARQNLEAEFEIAGKDFKVLNERLNELDNLAKSGRAPASPIELPPGVRLVAPERVSLRGVQTIHDRITKSLINRKRNKNTPHVLDENAALADLQKQMDEWLDQSFNNDLIHGDVDALAKWREAGEVRTDYFRKFHEDRTIMRFLNNENTPGEVHRWLLGANAVNAKPQAVRVIRRMKEILGDDSREIRSLKQEVTYDLAKPLLQDHPNFESFVRRVDDFFNNKKDLINELDFNTNDIKDLRNFAATALKTGQPLNALHKIDFVKNMARLLWGHGIAKAGVRVNLGTAILSLLGRKGKMNRKQMIFEISDTMFDQPVVRAESAAAGSVIEKYARFNMESVERQNEKVGN
jgi:hypothetical protein